MPSWVPGGSRRQPWQLTGRWVQQSVRCRTRDRDLSHMLGSTAAFTATAHARSRRISRML